MKQLAMLIWQNVIQPFFCSIPEERKAKAIKVPYFWATTINALNVVLILSILWYGRTELIPLVGITFVGSIGLIATYNQGKSSNKGCSGTCKHSEHPEE